MILQCSGLCFQLSLHGAAAAHTSMLSTSAFGRPCEASKGVKGGSMSKHACSHRFCRGCPPNLAWLRLMSFKAEFSLHCRACWVLQGREHSPNLLTSVWCHLRTLSMVS
jgi:hypothetical protein